MKATHQPRMSLAELDAEVEAIMIHFGRSIRGHDTLQAGNHQQENTVRFYEQWLKQFERNHGEYSHKEVTALLDSSHPDHETVMEQYQWMERLKVARQELKLLHAAGLKRSTTAH